MYRVAHADVTISVVVVLIHPTPGQVGHCGFPVTVRVEVTGQFLFLHGTVVAKVMVVVQSSGAMHLIWGHVGPVCV